MLKRYFEEALKKAIDQWELADKRGDLQSSQFFAGQIYALDKAAKEFGFIVPK